MATNPVMRDGRIERNDTVLTLTAFTCGYLGVRRLYFFYCLSALTFLPEEQKPKATPPYRYA